MRSAFLAAFVASALAASGARAQEKKKPEPPPGWQAKPFSLENPVGRLQDRPQGLRPGGLPLLPGLDGRGRGQRQHAARRRVRVAAGAHRPRGRVEAALVRGGRRPRVRRGGRAEGRVDRPAARPRRIQVRGGLHEAAGEPGVPDLAGEDRLRRARRRRRLDRTQPRLGRARPRGDLPRARVPGRGVRRATRARATAGRARRPPPASSSSRPGGSTSAARSRKATCRPSPAGPGLDPEPKGLCGHERQRLPLLPLGVRRTGGACGWGADARVQAGPFSLWGEFLETREQRQGQGPTLVDLPEVRGDGWSATATWLVTGEKKTRTIRPDRSLFGGPGAVELAARYEELRFDDVENEGFESAGSRAGQRPPRRLPRVHGRAQLVAELVPAPHGRRGRRALRRRPPRAAAREEGQLRDPPRARPGAPALRRTMRSLRSGRSRGRSSLLALLAACGGGGGGSPSSPATPAPAPTAAPGAPGGAPIFDPSVLHEATARPRPRGLAGAAQQLPVQPVLRGQPDDRRRGRRCRSASARAATARAARRSRASRSSSTSTSPPRSTTATRAWSSTT